eukprot:756701-Hanusia_phi.AAC.1
MQRVFGAADDRDIMLFEQLLQGALDAQQILRCLCSQKSHPAPPPSPPSPLSTAKHLPDRHSLAKPSSGSEANDARHLEANNNVSAKSRQALPAGRTSAGPRRRIWPGGSPWARSSCSSSVASCRSQTSLSSFLPPSAPSAPSPAPAPLPAPAPAQHSPRFSRISSWSPVHEPHQFEQQKRERERDQKQFGVGVGGGHFVKNG